MTRTTKALTIAGVTALAAALLMMFMWLLRPPSQAAYWNDLIAGGSEAEGMHAISRIAALEDDASIPLLVEALGSDRDLISSAAASALVSKVDGWELLAPDVAAIKIQQLAECLVAGVDACGPASRGFASDLASRILLWPKDSAAIDWASLLVNCETVVRAHPGPGSALDDRTAERRNAGPAEPQIGRPRTLLRHPQEASHGTARASGGRKEEIDVPPLPPFSNESDVIVEKADTAVPKLTVPDLAPREFIPPDSAVAATVAGEQAESPRQELTDQPDETAAATFHAPISGLSRPEDYRGMETLAVMRGLHAADATAARSELERRGFGRLELELARRLTDNDPAVRRDLAEKLPRLAAVDAKPWLLWFSRDADAGVRQVAVSLMGTTNDAEMLRRVADLGSTDPDPRIQILAARIADRGRQKRIE